MRLTARRSDNPSRLVSCADFLICSAAALVSVIIDDYPLFWEKGPWPPTSSTKIAGVRKEPLGPTVPGAVAHVDVAGEQAMTKNAVMPSIDTVAALHIISIGMAGAGFNQHGIVELVARNELSADTAGPGMPGHLPHLGVAAALRPVAHLHLQRQHPRHGAPFTAPGDAITQIHEAATFSVGRHAVPDGLTNMAAQALVGLQRLQMGLRKTAPQ